MSLELPLVVIDVQRAGPSTGMPTKTEQADLLQAMFGRNGEAPVPIVAPRSPADCFDTALEAARIATTYRTPVILLSDGYLANGSEPWRIPEVDDLPDLRVEFATDAERRRRQGRHRASPTPTCATPRRWPGRGRSPARRASSTASAASRRPTAPATSPTTRPTTTSWSAPGRRRSTAIAETIPPLEVEDPERPRAGAGARLGLDLRPDRRRVRRIARGDGIEVAQAHLRHLNPFPANLGDVLARYDKVLVPEMNLGQLAQSLLRAIPGRRHRYNQVRGLPFKAEELANVDRRGAIDGPRR